jgi:hypothetical protein
MNKLFTTILATAILLLVGSCCHYLNKEAKAEYEKCLAGGQSEETCMFYVYQ